MKVESVRWGDVLPKVEARIEALRDDLEAPTEDHLSTQYLRGMVAGLKEAMRMAESVIQPATVLEDPYERASL